MTTLDPVAPASVAPGEPRRRRPVRVRGGRLAAFAFAIPVLLIFGYFSWWPILNSIPLSFQHNNLIAPPEWIGFDNYRRVLADPLLGQAVLNSVWFTVLSVVIGFPLPIIFATYVAELRRTRQIATVLAYLPAVLPPVVSVLLWQEFFQPDADGLFNTVLGWLHLGPFPWLQDARSAMPSIVLQTTWAGFGYVAIIYLAALMSIRSELYDAAEVDGAGILRRAWSITLPQLRGVILLMLLLQLIGCLQVFTEPYVMTGGGPNNATVTVLMLIYKYAFIYGDFGKAGALSVLLALGLSVISIAYFVATRRWSPNR